MKRFIRLIVLVMACVLVLATLASCGKSLDSIKKKAEKAGYSVQAETLSEADEDGVVAVVRIADPNAKSIYSGIATAYEFKDTDSAKKAYEGAQEELEKAKEAAAAMGMDTGAVVKRSGKIVILGAEEIVKKVW